MKKNSVYRAALIGVTGFGESHYRDLMRERANGRAEIIAATVINEKTNPDAAERYRHLREIGCEVFTDYREMLGKYAGNIDLCCIPTGIGFHAEMTIAALEVGANVLVEKPAAGCLADVDAMRAAAEKSGKSVFVGFQHVYSANAARVKKYIADGRIGKVKELSCYAFWPRSLRYYHRNDWTGKIIHNGRMILDSPINNALAHYLNLMLYFASPDKYASAKPVALNAELYRANKIENFDAAQLEIEVENGAKLYYYVVHCCSKRVNPEIRIAGENGSITFSNERCELTDRNGKVIETVIFPEYSILRVELFDALYNHLRGDGKSVVETLDMARNHTWVVENAFRNFKIKDIPEQDTFLAPYTDGSEVRAVKNIEDLFLESLEKRCFISGLETGKLTEVR